MRGAEGRIIAPESQGRRAFRAIAPRKPTLRDDATFASLIRALPAGHLKSRQAEVAALARRLSALRAAVTARAEGGTS